VWVHRPWRGFEAGLERLTEVVWNVPRVRDGDPAARTVHLRPRRSRPRMVGAASIAMPASVATKEDQT